MAKMNRRQIEVRAALSRAVRANPTAQMREAGYRVELSSDVLGEMTAIVAGHLMKQGWPADRAEKVAEEVVSAWSRVGMARAMWWIKGLQLDF